MKGFKFFNNDVESTSDCVELLNKEIDISKWKRKVKFNLKANYGDSNIVRVFEGDDRKVSIVSLADGGTALYDLDLSDLRETIQDIQHVAKNYHTCDYGEIFLNPFTMSIWFVGGDGGIGYSTKSPKVYAKELEDGEIDDSNLRSFEEFIPEIKSTKFEAEYFPEEDEPWLFVAKANDICDYLY